MWDGQDDALCWRKGFAFEEGGQMLTYYYVLPPTVKMKVETCAFSQRKIYPSKGKLYVRGDSKVGSKVNI